MTKGCPILKILANPKNLSKVRIIIVETHKYKARIDSNKKLACFCEILKFVCTYRPSF
jgi:hypothetical protein